MLYRCHHPDFSTNFHPPLMLRCGAQIRPPHILFPSCNTAHYFPRLQIAKHTAKVRLKVGSTSELTNSQTARLICLFLVLCLKNCAPTSSLRAWSATSLFQYSPCWQSEILRGLSKPKLLLHHAPNLIYRAVDPFFLCH